MEDSRCCQLCEKRHKATEKLWKMFMAQQRVDREGVAQDGGAVRFFQSIDPKSVIQ
jgi:hypothetical protein